ADRRRPAGDRARRADRRRRAVGRRDGVGRRRRDEGARRERTFDLVVRMLPAAVLDLDGIRALPVLGPNGEKLTLGSLAKVDVSPGFARIFREENARRTAVKLSVGGGDLGSLVAEAQ